MSTSPFMLDVSNMIDERVEAAIFRATVTAIETDSVRIKRTGQEEEDEQDYAAVDIYPFPGLDDEVLVLKVGMGYVVLGRLVRSGLDVLHTSLGDLEVTGELNVTTGSVRIGDTYLFSPASFQIATSTLQTTAVIGIDGPLTDDPESNNSYWKLSGSADDNILASDLSLGVYSVGVSEGRLYVASGSFQQITLRTVVNSVEVDAFRASGFNNVLGCYVGPIIQPALANPGDVLDAVSGGVADIVTLTYLNGGFDCPGYAYLDTEADAATDDVDTITATGVTFVDGQLLVVSAANTARTIVLKDGTGNLRLAGDCTLDNTEDTCTLIRRGSNWLELCRSNNGA